jgi:hypothetical protein
VLDVEKAGMAGGSWTWSRLSRIVSILASHPSHVVSRLKLTDFHQTPSSRSLSATTTAQQRPLDPRLDYASSRS